jgi:hypothetical protein
MILLLTKKKEQVRKKRRGEKKFFFIQCFGPSLSSRQMGRKPDHRKKIFIIYLEFFFCDTT